MPQASINKFCTGVVDVDGNITLNFLENPGQGMQWRVNVNVMNSPSAVIWVLTVGFQQVGNWTGSAPFGPVKAINQETITIKGSGAQPGLMLNAQIVGWADYDDGEIVVANNVPVTATSVETVVKVVDGVTAQVAGNGLATFFIRPPLNARRLTIALKSNNGNVGSFSLVGQTTGIVWASQAAILWVSVPSGGFASQPYFSGAVEPLIDNIYSLFVSGRINDIITLYCTAAQTSPDVVVSSTLTPVQVSLSGGFPPNLANSFVLAANGNSILIAQTVGRKTFLNTLFLTVSGSSNASIVETVTGNILLAIIGSGVVALPMSAYQVNGGSVTLTINTYVSGTVIAGATWGLV